ncbi:rRNA pseudouridine synthase [Candidatus Saccharibacteria bacterium]|nr:rRNA pseudouridine synthase [Candidatus Saccharibacteria bacterium]
MTEEVRLNKYLATNFGVSRREADKLIEDGKVLINGKVAVIGRRVEPGDKVEISGKEIKAQKLIYLMLNKPKGYVCSRKRQGETPTIYELLPPEYQSLKNVGRLDKDSSGLILLTNDGDFAFQMTHPKFVKTKVYDVKINRELEPLHQQMIADFGVNLPDGRSKLGLMRISDDSRKDWQVTMTEGRNRQIRRTFEALGYKVTYLHRKIFGPYLLGKLAEGKYIEIDKK